MASFFRSDGWVKSSTGPAVPGAQIFVCSQPANTPTTLSPIAPSPLAPVYSDPNGLVPITQPIITDGFGHYDFYVAPGTYSVIVYLNGTLQQVYPDQTVGGAVSLSGDLGGTPSSPTVVATHLASPLPVAQGGTGVSSPGLIAGSGISITGTWPNQTVAATSSGSSTFPDPTTRFFGRTNIDLIGNGIQSGDPQVVWDAANNQWVMFYYVVPVSTPPFVQTWKAVATSLEGPWTGNTRLTTLDAYHKVRLLTDVNGALVTVGGSYYAVGVFYDGTIGHKQVFLFSNATLNGDTWAIQNSGNPVAPKSGAGGAGVYDDFCTDSPAFVFDGTTFYLWYTGFPSVSQSDFGLAPRILLTTATTVTGAYAKQAGFVLGSNTTGGAWDFGYAEGPQVMKNANGTYFMAYVGGNTRPVSAGTEPNTNLWGMATAPAITGPWTRVPGPFAQLTGLPQWPTGVPNSGSVGTIVDATNVWRPYLVLDPITSTWYVFYNTGSGGSPVERITYARQGILSFSNGAYVGGIATPPGPNGGYILILTTSELQIPGSQVFLRPGRYRVRYQVVQQDVGGTTPHLTGAFFIRPNGTKAGQWSQSFFANYAFEGDDFEVEDEIVVKAPAGIADNSQYTDASIQITSGSPTANTVARNLRVLIEQLD